MDSGIDPVPEPLRRLHLNGCRQVQKPLEILFSTMEFGASRTGLQMGQHFSRQLGSAGNQNRFYVVAIHLRCFKYLFSCSFTASRAR